MIGLFKRQQRAAPVDTSKLGESLVAMVVPAGSAQPAGCTAVLIGAQGRARRIEASARLAPEPDETAWLFRPGPYRLALRPFAAAPELGLRTSFVIDAPDPRAHQQRFDLYLASEVQGAGAVLTSAVLTTADLFAAIEAALQRELAQGHLELPPCTTLAEWNAFRAGLNRLLYLRFGVTVDECLPVDLGDRVDYAALLRQRAAAGPVTPLAVPTVDAGLHAASPPTGTVATPPTDAAALRRLFLELPCLMCALRVAVLPRGQAQFRRHQDLLRRLDLVSLQVTTMPAIELAAPNVPLDGENHARRAAHAARACLSLDDAWSLLARLQDDVVAGDGAAHGSAAPAALDSQLDTRLDTLLDDFERIVANLECDLAGRRAVTAPDAGAEVSP